jgi:hypothetical protein
MTTAVAWIVFPVVVYLVAAGVGLLVEWVARTRLPDGLLAPTGACLAVVVVLLVLELGGAGQVIGGVLVALALAGAIVRRRELSRIAPKWPLVAGLLVFALYMGPVVLSGHWTWLGYNFVNDTGTNLAVTEHLSEHGTAMLGGTPSTRQVVVNGTLGQSYPLGVHGLLAAFHWLVPVPVEMIYQPFIAVLAALGAIALASLATGLRVAAPAAALMGAVAFGANLTYQYALQGSFKEIAVAMVVATAPALCRFALDRRLQVGPVAIVGASLAAAVGVFSGGAAGYAAGLAVMALLAVSLERQRLRLFTVSRAAVVGAAALAIAVAPILLDTLSFTRSASNVFANTNADLSGPLSSPAVLGNLVRPLPLYQALGTWLRQDYRFPLGPGLANTANIALLVLAGALILVALVSEVRARRLGAMLAVVPALVVYLVGEPRLEPYAAAKLVVVLSPVAVFAAAVGAWWIGRRIPAAGIAVGVALAGGIVVSDALAYRNAHIVPVQRMDALRDAAEHARGRGPWLFPEWEEYAKHFGEAAPLNVASESFSPRSVALREPLIIFNHTFDLDEMTLEYVESFPGIMLRRSPEASRPPANYKLTYRNAYYELWEKDPAGPTVVAHLPLQRAGQAAVPSRCQDVRDLVARMRPGERLVAARRDALPTVGATIPPIYGAARATVTPNWAVAPDPQDPGTLITNGQGVLAGRLTVAAGRYEVWVKGGGGRVLHVSVDGRRIGSQRQINTPGQWLPFGAVALRAGSHRLELSRPGGGFGPGNRVDGPVGGIALERVPETRPLVNVPRSRAKSLCGTPWDWIERVSG